MSSRPTRNIEGLREREELHAHVEGTRIVEEASAGRAVEDDVGVGVIVDDHDVMCLREGDDLLVDLRRAHGANGVSRKRDHHVASCIGNVLRNALHPREKVVLRRERVVPGLCARKKRSRGKHRIAGVWDEGHIARVRKRGAYVPHALLGPAAAHDHGGRDALDAKARAVVVAYGLEQLVLVVQCVLPVRRVLGALPQRLDDVMWRLEVRRANREVEHLAALRLEFATLGVEGGKDLVAKQVKSP